MTERERLSEAGERRRVEMLDVLQRELARVKRSRQRREVAGGVAAAIVACGSVGLVLNGLRGAGTAPLSPTQPVVAHGGESGPAPPGAPEPVRASPRVTIAIVATDPDALRRFEARPQMAGLKILSDRELLEGLRAAGRDCGLIKMQGRAWLTCAVAPPGSPDLGGISGG